MARNKIGLQFEDFEEYMAKLDKLGGTDAMRQGVEEALIESKKYVNPQISQAMNKLPAGGKFSTGGTKKSIDTDMTVEWENMTASIKVGFKFAESGLKSIFLIQGTPKMKPVSGLKASIYGNKTQKAIAEIQGEALENAVKRVMEGG